MKVSRSVALPLAGAMLTGLAIAPSMAYPGGRGERATEIKRGDKEQRRQKNVATAQPNRNRKLGHGRVINEGGIAGATAPFNTCFEAGYVAGDVNGQAGWTTFPAASTGSNIINSASSPQGSFSLANTVTAGGTGIANGASTPPSGAPAGPGRYTVSYKLKISNTLGADYYVDAVSSTDALILAEMRFYYTDSTLDVDATPGDILIVDETSPGVLGYRATGLNYTPGVTVDVTMDINCDTDTVKYFINGAYVTTGVVLSPGSGVDSIDVYSDNYHLGGESGLFDCLSIEAAYGSCPADIVRSNSVDTDDLLAIVGGWGACTVPANCPADISPNFGTVDTDDLVLLIGSWGPCTVPTGGCCASNGNCTPNQTYAQCVTATGTFAGNDVTCAPTNPCPQPQPGDTCATALVMAVPYNSGVINTVAFANEGGLAGSCNSTAAVGMDNSIWFKYTATSACTLNFAVDYGGATGYDGLTAIYTGADCNNLAELDCKDTGVVPDSDTFTIVTVAGTTYWFQVGDYGTADGGGDTTVTLTCTP